MSQQVWVGQKICSSNKFPGDANAAGPENILWVLLISGYRSHRSLNWATLSEYIQYFFILVNCPLSKISVSSWKRQSEQILFELQMGMSLDLDSASLVNLFNLPVFLATDPNPYPAITSCGSCREATLFFATQLCPNNFITLRVAVSNKLVRLREIK